MSISFKDRITPFTAEHLEAIAKVLADTEEGLTGGEIDHILVQCDIGNPTPNTTKWRRLYHAFAEFQNKHQVGNHVIVFIKRAMNPAKYTNAQEVFGHRRNKLNPILAFSGLTLGDDGNIRKVQPAKNISEALERANRLQAQLKERKVHEDVLRYCSAEIVANNYFHTVFEAMKSITAKIRRLSGLTADGSDLVDQAFAFGKTKKPLLKINALDTETLEGEQKGFVNLLKGAYGVIRNPLAHNPKIEWDMNEQDALDILTMISLIHRKLDKTKRYPI